MPWYWPFKKRRQPGCPPQSEQAKQAAQAELEQVRARWPQVKERAESLRRGRERNGFGEAMLTLFRGEGS